MVGISSILFLGFLTVSSTSGSGVGGGSCSLSLASDMGSIVGSVSIACVFVASSLGGGGASSFASSFASGLPYTSTIFYFSNHISYRRKNIII